MDGWIKLHRKLLDNPIVCKDAEHMAVWIYLLLHAAHEEKAAVFKGEKIILQPGQLITGRLKIAETLHINESKVKRILTAFKSDQQIDQQTTNKNSLITVLRWHVYQKSDQQNDQPMTSKRPASDQQLTTNKNKRTKELKKEKEYIVEQSPTVAVRVPAVGEEVKRSLTVDVPVPAVKDGEKAEYPYKAIVDYLNEKAETKFRDKSRDTRRHIHARMQEGYTLDDFKRVIDTKVVEWKGTQWGCYLRPSTLFGTKFESYLNQAQVKEVKKNDTRRNTMPNETGLVEEAIKAGIGTEWEGF